MDTTFSHNNLVKLLFFPFGSGQNWKKFLIGSLIVLTSFIIPIFPYFITYGYACRIMRSILEDGEPVMPEWQDLGGMFTDGARLFGAVFLYSLPLTLMIIFFGTIMMGGSIFTMLASFNQEIEQTSFLPTIFWMIGTTGMGFTMLLGMVIGVITSPVSAHVVKENRFWAAFEPAGWWPVFRANTGGFLVAFIVMYVVQMLYIMFTQVLVYTMILCCLIPFFVIFFGFYLQLFNTALYASVYRDGLKKLEQS